MKDMLDAIAGDNIPSGIQGTGGYSYDPTSGIWNRARAFKDYLFSDMDSSGGYFSFLNVKGNWYIMYLTSSGARYCSGSSNYSSNWANRASLNYDYPYNIFQ